MININGLTCYYNGLPMVKNVHMTIEKGEMVSLVGPSGCGKTTLLKAICGLHEEVDGSLVINGKDVVTIPSHKRSTIMVFQEYLLYPHLNVAENIAFGLKMRGMKRKERYEKVLPLIEKMGLSGLEKRYPGALSGGQKQRVALARALAVEPTVLLLDEPFSNLDERLREDMRRFVCDLQEELGITTIFVTHDIEEALMSSNRVVVMLDGIIQQIDSPELLYRKPVNRSVAKMLGSRTLLEGVFRQGQFHWQEHAVTIPAKNHASDMEGMACSAVIMPDAISFGTKEGSDLTGRVIKVVFGGSKYIVMIDVDNAHQEFYVLPPQHIEVGEIVGINIDWDSVVLVPNK